MGVKKLIEFNLVKNKRLRLVLNVLIILGLFYVSAYILIIEGAPPPGTPKCTSPDGNEVLHLGFPEPRQVMTRPGYLHWPAIYGRTAPDTLTKGTFVGCVWTENGVRITTSQDATAVSENDDPSAEFVLVRPDGSLVPQDLAFRRVKRK